jgi:TonB family protein
MAASQRWPWFSLSLSLLLHVGAIGLVIWIDIAFPPVSPPQYDEAAPDDTHRDPKLIWYDFRKRVPEVTPDRRFGPFNTPHGLKDPNRTLVTVSKTPSSTRQLIRQPDHPEPLPADVPAPNLVAVEVKVKLPPKTFVPPPPPKRPQTVAPVTVEAAPVPDVPKTLAENALGAIASRQKLPSRAFVAPAASAGEAARQVEVPVAPSPGAPADQIPGLQAVIVGLNPGLTLPPPGSRSAQIARAPEAGTPSSGAAVAAGAIVVPGVLSHGKPGETTAPAPAPSGASSAPNRQPPQDIVLPGVGRTTSAPLRPSSRNVPALIEARFARRDVYALAIPAPRLPGYGGDWVLWFGEHNPQQNGPALRVVAPLPSRKYPIADADPPPPGLAAAAAAQFPAVSFQFGAMIDKTGRISGAEVIRGSSDPALRRRALEEVASWEFKPALRDGQPMDVDIVLDIPFRFPPTDPVPR